MNAIVCFEDRLRLQRPRDGDTRGQNARTRAGAGGGGTVQVCALEQPLHVEVLRFGGLDERFVVHGEIEDHVLAVWTVLGAPVHPLHAALEDVADLEAPGRVVVDDGRVRLCE